MSEYNSMQILIKVCHSFKIIIKIKIPSALFCSPSAWL